MILVDTSVWVDHFKNGEDGLVALLERSLVCTHPFVIGELACGNLSRRDEVLQSLGDLSRVPVASDEEVLFFIESNKLMGSGIGLVDAHLLAATALEDACRIWTRDKRLQRVATDLDCAHES